MTSWGEVGDDNVMSYSFFLPAVYEESEYANEDEVNTLLLRYQPPYPPRLISEYKERYVYYVKYDWPFFERCTFNKRLDPELIQHDMMAMVNPLSDEAFFSLFLARLKQSQNVHFACIGTGMELSDVFKRINQLYDTNLALYDKVIQEARISMETLRLIDAHKYNATAIARSLLMRYVPPYPYPKTPNDVVTFKVHMAKLMQEAPDVVAKLAREYHIDFHRLRQDVEAMTHALDDMAFAQHVLDGKVRGESEDLISIGTGVSVTNMRIRALQLGLDGRPVGQLRKALEKRYLKIPHGTPRNEEVKQILIEAVTINKPQLLKELDRLHLHSEQVLGDIQFMRTPLSDEALLRLVIPQRMKGLRFRDMEVGTGQVGDLGTRFWRLAEQQVPLVSRLATEYGTTLEQLRATTTAGNGK